MELSSEFDVYPTVFLFLGIIQLIRINGLVVILLSLIVAVRSGVVSATQQAELKSSSWSLSKKKKTCSYGPFLLGRNVTVTYLWAVAI